MSAMDKQYRIIHYTDKGKDVFQEYVDSLRDVQGKSAITKATDRLEDGNFGKRHFCRDVVWEIIIDCGPGYRIYYSIVGSQLILLLCAGSKRTQNKDIDRAVNYLKDFKEANQYGPE